MQGWAKAGLAEKQAREQESVGDRESVEFGSMLQTLTRDSDEDRGSVSPRGKL